MSIIIYEAKKMLIYQKGLLFIILYFILSTTSLIVTDKPYNFETELYYEGYSYYMNIIKGEFTNQKADFIENQAKEISNSKVNLDRLYNDYYDGKLTDNSFKKQSLQYQSELKNAKGFEEIYKQFIYVRDNIENRYFVYTNGWNGLLSNDNLNLFLTIVILLLVTPAFCYEYSSRINSLVLTTKKGERNYTVYKLIFVIFIVTVLCISTFSIKYIFYNLKYGLPNGDYPIQSLEFFGSYTKNISLIEGFLAVSALKLFGYIFFTIVILFISVLAKKYALTVFSSAAIALVPYLGFDKSLKYALPIPISFMLGTGFLSGTECEKNYFTDEVIITFKEISYIKFIILLAVSICICIMMVRILKLKNNNQWSTKKRKTSLKVTTIIVMFCVFCLSGCSATENNNLNVYNTKTRMYYETKDYKYYFDDSDLENIKLVFENKLDGEKEELVRYPIKSLIEIEQLIFGKGEYVYYIKHDIDKSKDWYRGGVSNNISVVEVDTKTFNEKIIFEHNNIARGNENFFGLIKSNNTQWGFLQGSAAFFLDEKYLYFVGEDITQVNRKSKEISIIDIPTNKNIAFNGRFIYYINDKMVLSKYDTVSKNHTTISEIITPYFLLTKSEILFINRLDNNKIYSADIDGGNIIKISDESSNWFKCDENYIIFENKKDLKEYSILR